MQSSQVQDEGTTSLSSLSASLHVAVIRPLNDFYSIKLKSPLCDKKPIRQKLQNSRAFSTSVTSAKGATCLSSYGISLHMAVIRPLNDFYSIKLKSPLCDKKPIRQKLQNSRAFSTSVTSAKGATCLSSYGISLHMAVIRPLNDFYSIKLKSPLCDKKPIRQKLQNSRAFSTSVTSAKGATCLSSYGISLHMAVIRPLNDFYSIKLKSPLCDKKPIRQKLQNSRAFSTSVTSAKGATCLSSYGISLHMKTSLLNIF